MPLTDSQKDAVQRLLLAEVERRAGTQPFILVESILDGTAKQKLKMLVLQERNRLQSVVDEADAKLVASKARINVVIEDLNAANTEIV